MEERKNENAVRELVRILRGFTPEQLDRFQIVALRIVDDLANQGHQDKGTQAPE